ncbi:UDP-N-acetylmuramoyl-tripeptide--D-alanyl-D-alanine ligase [bacterium BMS3Abin03]|nr:UDP-N-acetylmuramoyl-tripeptide--D-alanyl-D-alanine ligase [bacterium BMS3Abin03]HDZ58916.1 UDP-N-acetylmuramoyl-tripeptide--D-alanyl-D-alanine ligase [Ignavibacteriales bacterium]
MVTLTIEDLFNVPTAVIYNPDELKPVKHVAINSREVKKGSLFIAIKGKRFDGHQFVKQAVRNGAGVLLVSSRKLAMFDNVDVPVITVRNTTKALGDIAAIWRKKLKAKIIGLTGSAGKTSTKEMIATILSEKYRVNKTIENNNNHIGVPLTILSTNLKHDVLVAELGTNHFGEIEYTANILQPDFALITNIGDSHLEFLKRRKGVLKEKAALFDVTLKRHGKIFVNYDDPLLKSYAKKKSAVSYGFNGRPKVKGQIEKFTNDGKAVVAVKTKSKKIVNELPVYGGQNAKNYLAAVAVADFLKLTKKEIKEGTKKLSSPDKRLKVKTYKNFLVIDDTYNASPDSTKAAIELVNKIKTFNRKVLVLGDMFELGKDKIKLHRSLSSVIAKNKIDEVYSIGSGMKALNDALNKKRVVNKHFRTRKLLRKFLGELDLNNSVILIKGSRGMRMEEFLKIIEDRVYS